MTRIEEVMEKIYLEKKTMDLFVCMWCFLYVFTLVAFLLCIFLLTGIFSNLDIIIEMASPHIVRIGNKSKQTKNIMKMILFAYSIHQNMLLQVFRKMLMTWMFSEFFHTAPINEKAKRERENKKTNIRNCLYFGCIQIDYIAHFVSHL